MWRTQIRFTAMQVIRRKVLSQAIDRRRTCDAWDSFSRDPSLWFLFLGLEDQMSWQRQTQLLSSLPQSLEDVRLEDHAWRDCWTKALQDVVADRIWLWWNVLRTRFPENQLGGGEIETLFWWEELWWCNQAIRDALGRAVSLARWGVRFTIYTAKVEVFPSTYSLYRSQAMAIEAVKYIWIQVS